MQAWGSLQVKATCRYAHLTEEVAYDLLDERGRSDHRPDKENAMPQDKEKNAYQTTVAKMTDEIERLLLDRQAEWSEEPPSDQMCLAVVDALGRAYRRAVAEFTPRQQTPHATAHMGKSVRCRNCKRKFRRQSSRGPVPLYCSRSCEGQAYRKRAAKRNRFPGLKALKGDLFSIRDRTARLNAALKVLHEARYAPGKQEHIRPIPDPPPKLRLVPRTDKNPS
jgi:hypothetical protein